MTTHRCVRCGAVTCSCQNHARPDICDPCVAELLARRPA